MGICDAVCWLGLGIIGAIWGFFDGAIGGAIIAFVYDAVAKKNKCEEKTGSIY